MTDQPTLNGRRLDAWDDSSVTIDGKRITTGESRVMVVDGAGVNVIAHDVERTWHGGGSTTKRYDPDELAERFWTKVDKRGSDDCWVWTAGLTPSGYGQFMVSQEECARLGFAHRSVAASRVACTLGHGVPTRDDLHALHSCDNPPCCNPSHLRWGTQAENNREAWLRGRQRSGEAHHQARLSDDQVREVLSRARAGERVADLAAEYGAAERSIYGWLQGKGRGRLLVSTEDRE